MHRILGAVAGAALLAACGGSDPGSGTGTLFVNAIARTDGSANGTTFGVEVRNGSSNGAVLNTAVVEIFGDKGLHQTLPFQGVAIGGFIAGSYVQQGLSWEGGWRLRVSNANDNLEAYIAGPGLTEIVSPAAGTTFDRATAQPLLIQWRDQNGRAAQSADIDFRRSSVKQTVQDTGSFSVDASQLVAATDERITISRFTEITLKGGAPGSKMRAESSAERAIIVQ